MVQLHNHLYVWRHTDNNYTGAGNMVQLHMPLYVWRHTDNNYTGAGNMVQLHKPLYVWLHCPFTFETGKTSLMTFTPRLSSPGMQFVAATDDN